VNLLCPVLDRLGGAGKTRIDLRPFEEDIAKAVSGIAYKMPTFHGQIDYIDYDISEPVKTATDYLDEFLIQRRKDIEADPSLKITDRLTQASVFYRVRPAMIEDGFKPRKTWSITRETIQGDINNRCQALWPDEHIVREDLGIIAKPRAIMYYKGVSYPVSVDNAKSLAENGVIVIVIEKQGIADVLNTFADKYGVALVHTGGHFVEYCKDLIDAVDDSGGKIATLTDFDAAGIIIAEGARIEIPRIGIDRNTVVYFQQHGFPNLTEADVEETYRPNVSTDIEYLQTKRIELDSILAKVRAKALWEYIEHQLLEAFPEGIDYNRVISSTPELSDPDPISEITDYFTHIQNKATTDKSEEIEQELSNVKGLPEVDQKQDEIKEELQDVVNNEPSVKLLISLFKELKAKLIQKDQDAAHYWKSKKDRIVEGREDKEGSKKK
jgi:Protein of unknown function C-terminus (DUF2399)